MPRPTPLVGHRALVAVERADGHYDLYHAQWGADDSRLGTILAADDGCSVGYLLDALGGVGPVASGVGVGGTLDSLDPLTYEALLVLADEPTVYLVVAVRVETAGTATDRTAPEAVLVPIADVATAAGIRRYVRTVASVLGDAVDAGLVSPALARGYLRARLASHPDVSPDSLWLALGDSCQRP